MKEAALIDTLQEAHRKARAPRKPSALQVLVEQNYGYIRNLRDKKPKAESWRTIAENLVGRFGQSVSHTGLKNIFERLEEESGPAICQ